MTQPTLYSGYVITQRKDAFDLIDPHTRRWASFPTQRYARWSATFMRNINARFDANQPLAQLPKVDP